MPSTWMFRISCGSTSRGASDRFPAQAVAVATAAGPRIALREIRLAGDSSKRRGAGCEELEVGTGAGHRQPEPRLEPQTRIPGPRPRTHGPGTRATTRGSARRRSHARAAFLLCARRIPLSSPWACHRRLPYSEGWSPCVPPSFAPFASGLSSARIPHAVVRRYAAAGERADRSLQDHSPLEFVSQVKTPTLFLVGKQDPRFRCRNRPIPNPSPLLTPTLRRLGICQTTHIVALVPKCWRGRPGEPE